MKIKIQIALISVLITGEFALSHAGQNDDLAAEAQGRFDGAQTPTDERIYTTREVPLEQAYDYVPFCRGLKAPAPAEGPSLQERKQAAARRGARTGRYVGQGAGYILGFAIPMTLGLTGTLSGFWVYAGVMMGLFAIGPILGAAMGWTLGRLIGYLKT